MATGYSLYVRHEVYQLLANVRKQQRSQILDLFDSLEADPFQPGDYELVSPENRSVQVKIAGAFAILFWADHAACEIKVVDLVPADA